MKYILLIPIFLLFGCRDSTFSKVPIEIKEQNVTVIDTETEITTIEIDSCEYLVYDGHNSGCIIHKANCNNHKNK